MTDDDDIEGLAAEYVVGSLDPVERQAVGARRRTEAALDQAIKAWEKRIGTLGDLAPGLEPGPDVFPRVANQLWGPQERVVGTVRGAMRQQSTSRWRAAVAGACALAACLAMIVVWPQNSPGSPAKVVAELQRSAAITADGATIPTVPLGFVVYFDLRASTMIVNPLAVPPGSRRDYQLWLVPQDSASPISLGVISLTEPTTSPWLATYPPYDLVHATLAVSLEPAGGAPKGIPSGPTVFVGKLVQARP